MLNIKFKLKKHSKEETSEEKKDKVPCYVFVMFICQWEGIKKNIFYPHFVEITGNPWMAGGWRQDPSPGANPSAGNT